jgi:putative ABC transport system ATP-binding protein
VAERRTLADATTVAALQGVVKRFRDGADTCTALHPTDLVVRGGELLLLAGPSGSGKTTVLSLLGCVLTPSAGAITVCGRDVGSLAPRELAALRRRSIGFVFQSFNLLAALSARDNVALPLLLSGVSRTDRRARADAALGALGLREKARALPRQLSGGQQQRVAVARALVGAPALLLCDEPTAALDPASARVVMASLAAAAADGRAVVVVTHDARLAEFAHRVVHMADGRIVSDAPVQPIPQPPVTS